MCYDSQGESSPESERGKRSTRRGSGYPENMIGEDWVRLDRRLQPPIQAGEGPARWHERRSKLKSAPHGLIVDLNDLSDDGQGCTVREVAQRRRAGEY
jgi:hypothetical protein